MPNFQGEVAIIVQPTTRKAPYTLRFTVCSSEGANDGELPYGDSLDSCTVKVYRDGSATEDPDILESSAVDGNDVKIEVNWPTTNGAGRYKITMSYTSANGYTDEVDLKWILAVDK